MGCVPWNPIGCASDVAKAAASDAFSSIAHDFGQMAGSAVNWLWGQTSDATAVHLGGAGWEIVINPRLRAMTAPFLQLEREVEKLFQRCVN